MRANGVGSDARDVGRSDRVSQTEDDHSAVDDGEWAVEQKLGEASRPWPRLLILLLIHSRQRATTSYHETAD